MYNFKKRENTKLFRVENRYYLFEYNTQKVNGSFEDIISYLNLIVAAPYQEVEKDIKVSLLKDLRETDCTRKQFEKELLSCRDLNDIFKDTNLFDDFIRSNKKLHFYYTSRSFDDNSFLLDAIELSKKQEETYVREFLVENLISDEIGDIVIEVELKAKTPWFKIMQKLVDYNFKYEEKIIKAGYFEYLKTESLFRYVIDNINMKLDTNIKALKYISSKTDKYDDELIQLDINNKNKYTRGAIANILSLKTDKYDETILNNYLTGFNIFERTRKYDQRIINAISDKRIKSKQESFIHYLHSIVRNTDKYNLKIIKNYKYISRATLFNLIVTKENILNYASYLYKIKDEFKNIQLMISEETDKYDSYFLEEGNNYPVLELIFKKGHFSDEDFLNIQYLPAMKRLMEKSDKYDELFLLSSNGNIRNQLLLTGRIPLEKFEHDRNWVIQNTLREMKVA